MRAALATVVNVKGTGKRAIVPGFIGCGKTGTARKLWNGIYYQDRYAVSFVGFLPRDDPAFVCVVVIDDPLQPVDHIGGGTVAASFLKAGLIDRIAWFHAPVIVGGDGLPAIAALSTARMADALRLERLSVEVIGDDVLEMLAVHPRPA